jgi:hypothetical protein
LIDGVKLGALFFVPALPLALFVFVFLLLLRVCALFYVLPLFLY